MHNLFCFQTAPTTEELGSCDMVKVDEIGDTSVIIFKQGKMFFKLHSSGFPQLLENLEK